MDGEVAPEFIYDQGLYYPANGNYYGYVCTGMEPPSEWEDHHKFVGLDGQNVQFSALQTESLPCLYYTPSYDYAQSPFNPFNPYIPGAVIGTDAPFMGPQQCFTNSSYMQTVSQPGYIPVITQPGPDALVNNSNPFLFSGGAVKYTPALSSMSVTTTPLKASLENLSLEPSHSYSNQIQIAGRLFEGSGVNVLPRAKFSQYGDVTSGGTPQMTQMQGPEYRPYAGVHSSPLKVTLPANNGFTNPGSNGSGWASGDRVRPKIPYSSFPNRSVGEQNMGPRTNGPKTQLRSPITLRSYTTKSGNGNLNENIVVHADKFNKNDFPVDYPDAKFFVIKSYSEDDVHKSIKYNVWSSTTSGNKKLDFAYEEAQRLSVGKPKCPVFLFFSVNASGHFCGVAEMIGPVDFHKDMDFWLQDKWTGCFPVKWHIIKDVPNASFRHIILVNNEYRPVTSSRDTQEVPYLPGINMLTIFKNSPMKTSILDDFMYYEERQRIMHEEKTMFLGTKSYETSATQASVPSVKLSEEINQLPIASGKQPNGKSDEKKMISHTFDHDLKADDKQTSVPCIEPTEGINQAPVATGKQSDGKSDGKRMASHAIDQDLKVDDEDEKEAGLNQPNGKLDKPSKSNSQISSAANLPVESDGRQTHRKASQPSKAKSYQAKNQSVPKGVDRSGQNDAHAISRHATKDPQDEVEKSVEKSTSSKVEEEADTDTFTVGSMRINITDTNRSISGTLTIGSITSDARGSKP